MKKAPLSKLRKKLSKFGYNDIRYFIPAKGLVSDDVISIFHELLEADDINSLHELDRVVTWKKQLKKLELLPISRTKLKITDEDIAKILSGVPDVVAGNTIKTELETQVEIVSDNLVEISKAPSTKQRVIHKLGLVKFIALDFSHAYVVPFKSPEEVFYDDFLKSNGQHISSKEGVNTIVDLEKFQLISYTQQKGEVVNANNKLNSFIVNEKNTNRSYAILLIKEYLNFKFPLSKKYKSGFAILNRVKSNKWDSGWDVSECSYTIDEDMLIYAKEVLKLPLIRDVDNSTLLALMNTMNPNEVIDYYMQSPELKFQFMGWLLNLYQAQDATNLEATYIWLVEQGWKIDNEKQLVELIDFLKVFKTAYPNVTVDESRCQCINSSFLVRLFQEGILSDISESHILAHIYSIRSDSEKAAFIEKFEQTEAIGYYMQFPELKAQFMGWLLNLYQVQETANLEATFKWLVEQGWKIDKEKQLVELIDFLKVFKVAYPKVVMAETSFECENSSFIVRLFKEGILTKISDVHFINHINSLPGNTEKAAFIETLEQTEAIKYYKQFPELKLQFMQWLLNLYKAKDTAYLEATYKWLTEQSWKIDNKKQFAAIIDFLKVFKVAFPDVTLTETSFKSVKSSFLVMLSKEGILTKISDVHFINHINSLRGDTEKATFIETLGQTEAIKFYKQLPELKDQYTAYEKHIIDSILVKLPCISFDLECVGNRIEQYGSITNEGIEKRENDYEYPDAGLNELVALLSKAQLIVGHNVKKFDIPILQERGVTINASSVWDTLEIEMLLNSCRNSYGLRTKHVALDDAKLTYQLFKNQILRILANPDIFKFICPYLPSIVMLNLIDWGTNQFFASVNAEEVNNNANDFFRPDKIDKTVLSKELDKLIKKSKLKILIAPTILWSSISRTYKTAFMSSEGGFNYVLDKQKVTDSNLSKQHVEILLNYINLKEKSAQKPYWQHLPAAIRILIGEEKYALLCVNEIERISFSTDEFICINPNDLDTFEKLKNLLENPAVVLLEQKLSLITSKVQLGEEFSISHLVERLQYNPIWVQLSGGRNYIRLTAEQCTLLDIDAPLHAQNIWMEKVGRGRFKVWYNSNLLSGLKEDVHLVLKHKNEIKSNAYIIRPKTGDVAEQRRLNPETLQRAMYWTYQFKMMEGLLSKVPMVLILNDDAERGNLIQLARNKGYFIPDEQATLVRQLELLHNVNKSNKLLLTTIEQLPELITSNYLGELNFIWESFLLYEKNQMLHDIINDPVNQFNSYELLAVHKPLIDYFNSLITNNFAGSKLYLIDTRLSDYFGIEKALEVNTQTVPMWASMKEYGSELEAAYIYFAKENIGAQIDFSSPELLETAKEIIRQLFLKENDSNSIFPWHDYQIPVLNNILPANKDLVISLPTGAGKSVLFQGPALFRSAYTNKLTIVISPLRALMQDQADSLWKKGFYGNVNYLSSDKSQEEVRDIYRRVAGGEITLLYITPERFRSRSFENAFYTRLTADNGLEYVVFDEAHCVSQWGHEFRPDYLNAARKIAGLSKQSENYSFTNLLFSATISEQVFEEIKEILPSIQRIDAISTSYNPVQEHIQINFKSCTNEEEKLTLIAEALKYRNFEQALSKVLIFVSSRTKTTDSAKLMPVVLKKVFGEACIFADKVGAFHAGMNADDRHEVYARYKAGDLVILFATKAFGMGMDIANIHFLFHFSPPGTFEDFLQEIGRAGRNKKQRELAGFTDEKPIDATCLIAPTDFKSIKDRMQSNKLTWHKITEIKSIIENHVKKINPYLNSSIPVAIPFSLYSIMLGTVDDEIKDTTFRMAMHWLEKLKRIKLGYITITHLSFDKDSLTNLEERLKAISDPDIKEIGKAVLASIKEFDEESSVVQISLAQLRAFTKFSMEKILKSLILAHKNRVLKLIQDIIATHTNQRTAEVKHFSRITNGVKYPALQVVFDIAVEILLSVKEGKSKVFGGEELDKLCKDAIYNHITAETTLWLNPNGDSRLEKSVDNYIKDIKDKRVKHAFSILRLLVKVKHETQIDKEDKNKIAVMQFVYNGFHKKSEWTAKLETLKQYCITLMDEIGSENILGIRKFNWPDLINKINVSDSYTDFSNALFALSILGYLRTSSTLPMGIEVNVISSEALTEANENSNDFKVYEDFGKVQEMRELKLMALQILSRIDNVKHDEFIKRFFTCNSVENYIRYLIDYSNADDPIFRAFRAVSIKEKEYGLNEEQKKIYFAEINQHINVVAGPGSGKTHTLMLRVARLVHHIGVAPEEILVLAYNRAVISELQSRLGNLFYELGYGNLVKRIKIMTFHGAAKRYCWPEIVASGAERDLKAWEKIFLRELAENPGIIMNRIGRLSHILVDEFQDIDNIRIGILKRLVELNAEEAGKSFLFTIGDPNQSIYGYDREVMDPYYYYDKLNTEFAPKEFPLVNNHRSYAKILENAAKLLNLPEKYQHLIPRAIFTPDEAFLRQCSEYVSITNNSEPNTRKWWEEIKTLLDEKYLGQPYRQIAVLFRSNNEVYRGYQRIQEMKIPDIRIRIQGSMPYEFTRVRECFEVISWLKDSGELVIAQEFKQHLKEKIDELVEKYKNWNHFYLRVVHAIILDFLEQQEEKKTYTDLVDFISELSYRDDGQLYKIYEKHFLDTNQVETPHEIEIVLTTMHKVKGLEFDAVVITPSFSRLPFQEKPGVKFEDQCAEENRILYVSYTRAKYRLCVFTHEREHRLKNCIKFASELDLGFPVKPELQKLFISWGAKEENFSLELQEYIKTKVKSGDSITIKGKSVIHGGKQIGCLSSKAFDGHPPINLTGFVVNEVVAWTYEETLEGDRKEPPKNPGEEKKKPNADGFFTTYHKLWCDDAKEQKYIYLVDLAGYGKNA